MIDIWYNFQITVDEQNRVEQWLCETVYPLAIERQKASGRFKDNPRVQEVWDMGFPYGGAIGGGVSYKFTPNSIGLSVKVVESFTGDNLELDLTDYDSW